MVIKKQQLMIGGILASLAMLIMSIHTVWFGTRQDPFTYTLSMMANRYDLMRDFIIWGTMTGLIILIYMLQIFRTANYRNQKARRYLILSSIFLVLTVITPAVEEVNALTHKLHFLFAVLFAVLLSLSIYFFLRFLKSRNVKMSKRFIVSYVGVLVGGLFVLLLVGPNAVFEIFFFLALTAYLLILNSSVRKLEIK